MNQVILASHGGLAAGMRDTVELIVGEVPNVHVLSTTRDETEPIAVRARRLLEGFDPADAVYILTDVMGGSVNNDMLTILFMCLIILESLKWIRAKNLAGLIRLALYIGFGMITKLNSAVLAIPLAIIFSRAFYLRTAEP